jgi:electron transfer flavoprotein beta subunit
LIIIRSASAWPTAEPHVAVVTKRLRRKGIAPRIEGGSEVVESLPAVITCQKPERTPIPSLKGIMQAKKKPLAAQKPADIGASPDEVGKAGAKVEVVAMTMPPDRPAGRVVPGEPEEAAKEVVKLLRNEAKVI